MQSNLTATQSNDPVAYLSNYRLKLVWVILHTEVDICIYILYNLIMKFEFDVKKDVEYSLESKKIDLEFFCKLNELTRKTIYNQAQQPNNFKTLNKIYNGIYDLGIRLNKIKAEIYQETTSDKNIILFHGSKYGLDEITHDGSRNCCDFGILQNHTNQP